MDAFFTVISMEETSNLQVKWSTTTKSPTGLNQKHLSTNINNMGPNPRRTKITNLVES